MPISPLPTPPSRNDPTNFSARADAFLGALPTFQTEANALEVAVDADAVAAAASSAAAAASVVSATAAANAAAASANVTKWISGTTYTEGAVVWSPITYLTYRRKTTGGGTTDPSADSTNWTQAAGTGNVSGPGSATNNALVAFDGTTGTLIKQAPTVTVAQGGTGTTSLTANNVLLGNNTNALQVVAPGTSGNVLTSNGTTWASAAPPGGGSWIYITQVTGSAVSTIDVDSTYTGYDVFAIIGEDIRVNSFSNDLEVQFKLSGTYSTSNYLRSYIQTDSSGTSITARSGASSVIGPVPQGSANSYNIVMYVYNPSNASARKTVSFHSSMIDGTTLNAVQNISGSVANTVSAALTGVRFLAAGVLLSGTFRLYGIKNS